MVILGSVDPNDKASRAPSTSSASVTAPIATKAKGGTSSVTVTIIATGTLPGAIIRLNL